VLAYASLESHDVKQRSLLRCRGACRRPGWSLSFAPFPKRGGRSADRRTCVVVALARRDHPRSVRRGASHDAGRSPLGAPPWRFSAGGRASISGIASGSVQRAPRSQVVMPGGRCPGPPEPAVTSRSRGTPLPAPPAGSSLDLNFQEVVHSVQTGNADFAKRSDSRRTEWTRTRMPA
jgi:hypothetical protein